MKVNPPADIQVPVSPLDPNKVCEEPVTRECMLELNSYLLEEWALAARKTNNWIEWCIGENFCGKPSVDDDVD